MVVQGRKGVGVFGAREAAAVDERVEHLDAGKHTASFPRSASVGLLRFRG